MGFMVAQRRSPICVVMQLAMIILTLHEVIRKTIIRGVIPC